LLAALNGPICQRRPTQLQPFEPYLRERLAAIRELTGRRLHRELAALGYRGGYTAVTDLLREIRPVLPPPPWTFRSIAEFQKLPSLALIATDDWSGYAGLQNDHHAIAARNIYKPTSTNSLFGIAGGVPSL
jgi:hypothetical protein